MIYGQTQVRKIFQNTTKIVQYEIKNKQEHEQLSDEFECSSRRRPDMNAMRCDTRNKMNENEKAKKEKKNQTEQKHTINANHLFAIHTPDNQLINYVI